MSNDTDIPRAASQAETARRFAALHRRGAPLVLYNAWDAGSAQAIAAAGATAIATGSWSVAAAQGYADGERIPFDLALGIYARIVAATDLPVTVDFEGGYARAPDTVTANVARLLETGAVGLNFEDGIVGEGGVYPVETQGRRLAAVRAAGDEAGVPLFVNARTDLFLQEPDAGRHAGLVEEAIARGRAYTEAGADGYFVPGLLDPALIERVCAALSLPVNVMTGPGAPPNETLARAGVARISYGPHAYLAAMKAVGEAARAA